MAGYSATIDDITRNEIVAGASLRKDRGTTTGIVSLLSAVRQLIVRQEDGLCMEKRTIDPSAMTAASSGQIGHFLLF